MSIRYKSTFYILAFIVILSNNYIFGFRCGKDKLKIKPKKIKSSNVKRKLSTSYTPISIKVDYTYLDSQNIVSADNMLKLKSVISETINALSSLLEVKHQDVEIDKDSVIEFCEIPVIADDYSNFLYENDLLILPYIDTDYDENVLASAVSCMTLEDFQPKIGILALNGNITFAQKDTENYLKMLLLHEITHILIFDPYILENIGMLQYRNGLAYVDSSRVIDLATKHFGCKLSKGVQLENQGDIGSVGSHWEARYMLGDYMIAFDYPEIVISEISLALFEDSGWYKVNYYTGGLFKFGKNMGCGFLNSKCLTNDGWETSFPNEFCTSGGDAFCSNGHLSRGDCYLVEYESKIENENYRYFKDPKIGGLSWANYCPVSQDYDYSEYNEYYYPNNCKWGEIDLGIQYGEKIGDNSLCFESSLVPENSELSLNKKISICYEMKCTNENIIIHIENNEIICPVNGGIIKNPNGFIGEINCPKYNIICTTDIWCNDAFECINKKSIPYIINSNDTNNYENEDDYNYDDNNNNKNNNSGWILFLIRNKLIILLGIFNLLF